DPSRVAGDGGGRTRIRRGAVPYQYRRPGPRCRGAQRGCRGCARCRGWALSPLEACLPCVHDLDSFDLIPLKSKVARFAGSLAADRPAGWVKAGRGEGGSRARTRPGGRCRRRHRRAIGQSAGAIGAIAASPAGAAERSAPGMHGLYELALNAHRGIAQHEITALILVAGVALFAVTTAIV